MTYGSNPERSPIRTQLVDDAVGAHPQGAEPSQKATQQVSRLRVPLQHAQRRNNGVGYDPVQRQ